MNEAPILTQHQNLVNQRAAVTAQTAAHDIRAGNQTASHENGRPRLDRLTLSDRILDLSGRKAGLRSRRSLGRRGAKTSQQCEAADA